MPFYLSSNIQAAPSLIKEQVVWKQDDVSDELPSTSCVVVEVSLNQDKAKQHRIDSNLILYRFPSKQIQTVSTLGSFTMKKRTL